MSSLLSEFPSFWLASVLRLAGILVVALLVNRLFRVFSESLVQPATSPARAAQAREQQTRALATTLYRVGSKIVWAIAFLLAVQEFGINILPAVLLVALAAFALALGAQNLVRDALSGFQIILEDQFSAGDTIQIADTVGRVEHLTLRRTVVRDSRGALVTFSNGDIRTVGNLSRDWSQTFVDVAVSPEVLQERTIQALDAAAAQLRNDPAWSHALVDGPRILGLQSYDQNVCTVRMQVRTAPSRHEDVARELRRRIQLEFQKQGIAVSSVQRVELVNAPAPKTPGPPVSSI